jgi:hypothetical protein
MTGFLPYVNLLGGPILKNLGKDIATTNSPNHLSPASPAAAKCLLLAHGFGGRRTISSVPESWQALFHECRHAFLLVPGAKGSMEHAPLK